MNRHFLRFKAFPLFSALLFLVSAQPAFAKRKLTLLLMPLDSPSAMYARFQPFKRYLEARLGIPVEIEVAKKRSDIIPTLEEGGADLAFLCPSLYCEASKQMRIVPLAKLRVNGSSVYRSVILVRSDSGIKNVSALRGGTFVYGRYYCPGSGLLPDDILRKAGIKRGGLMDTVILGSNESAILAVMARLFDATGVSEVAARPYLSKGLRIIGYSRPIPQYLFAARGGLQKGLLLKLEKAMLLVNRLKDPGSVVGSIEPGADGLSKARDRDYDIVRALVKKERAGKGLLIR